MVKKFSNKKIRIESKESDYHTWIDSLYYPGFADDMEKLSPKMQDMLKAEYDNYLYSRGIKESRKVRNGNKRKFEAVRMTPLPKNLFDRAEELDFSDDGAKFRMYKYKGRLPISVSSGYGMVFVCIRPDYVRKRKDYNSHDYYKFCDEFNGVDTAYFNNNMDKFIDNCEKMYDVLFGQNGYAESRKNRKIREGKQCYKLITYGDGVEDGMVFYADLSDKDVKAIYDDINGVGFGKEYLITTKDGEKIDIGIIDEISKCNGKK